MRAGARGYLPKFYAGLDAFCLVEDEGLRPETLKLVQTLRSAGFSVDYPLTPAKPASERKKESA